MTDEDIRAINRAIAEVEDQDIRETARTALHHVFGRESKLEKEYERLKEELRDRRDFEIPNLQARLSAMRSSRDWTKEDRDRYKARLSECENKLRFTEARLERDQARLRQYEGGENDGRA